MDLGVKLGVNLDGVKAWNWRSARKILKWQVRLLQRLLPAPLFDLLYRTAFPAYRAVVRCAYLAVGAFAYSWRDRQRWQMVKDIYRIMPYTLVGIGGLEVSYRLAKRADEMSIEGDVVELGVARGGCAALLGRAIMGCDDSAGRYGRQLWLFDSYEGLPEPTDKDFREGDRTAGTGDHVRPLPKGSCLGTLEDVKQLILNRMALPEEKVHFVKGWFQNTVPARAKDIPAIAVLRIDGDWYESTRVCLNGLYDNVVRNGAVIIDDYQSCYGCELAVKEFLAERGLHVEIRLDGRGGCYFIKP